MDRAARGRAQFHRCHRTVRRNAVASMQLNFKRRTARIVVMGQSRRFRDVRVTSAYAPRAATKLTLKHFAFVPAPDIQ
jgi:hypothetical protein